MTTYYVGKGGDNGNNGTSWALRKLTLNGAEDIPVAAGDTVYVGAGTYNETLEVDVSGTSGNVISYIGDYSGANTDGTGGVVRISGANADDNITPSLDYGIDADGTDFRLFRGFTFELFNNTAYGAVNLDDCEDVTIDKCIIQQSNSRGVNIYGADQKRNYITNCVFNVKDYSIFIAHTSDVNADHIISNCIIYGVSGYAMRLDNVGDITIKNSMWFGGVGMRLFGSPEAGHPIVVNNCVIANANYGFNAPAVGDIVEDYNAIFNCVTARTNTDTGAHSNAYPALYDTRWFHELVGGGSILSPFDLASYCALINVAGTSPTTADMRGTTVQGTQREWGALEYDSSLDIEAGSGSGGGVSRSRILGGV